MDNAADLQALQEMPATACIRITGYEPPFTQESTVRLSSQGCLWVHSHTNRGEHTRSLVISLTREGIDRQHELEDLAGFPRTPRQLGMWNQ